MNIRRLLSSICSLLLITGLVSCSDDSPTGTIDDTEYDIYLDDFSHKVAVATYSDMKAKGVALDGAVEAFAADPNNQAKLDAACTAWRGMREPWEASEAFLFGPAEFLSLDPALDSWPVDRQQLEDVLNSEFELTPEFIAEGLGPALRGFHTVEFLLFADGAPRDVATFTEREREYLVAVTQVLADDAARLAEAWEDGFADEFANAGKAGSRYQSQTDAVLEMIEGMSGICDEVANGKIADPFDEQDTRLVESQFSWNSLDDFANNVRSVRNVYTGGYHNGEDGKGIDELVAEKNAALDTRLKAEIDEAIAAIGRIPAPFRDNLDATTEIEAAQEAVLTVFNTLENDVKPLFVN